jgi:predicted nucleic acid-binding protein
MLASLLDDARVLAHPYVIGELVLGNLPQRDMLVALQDLPSAIVASHDEVMAFIIGEELTGLGIGYVDAHLLAAARLTPGTFFWTRDKRLMSAAKQLAVAAHLTH